MKTVVFGEDEGFGDVWEETEDVTCCWVVGEDLGAVRGRENLECLERRGFWVPGEIGFGMCRGGVVWKCSGEAGFGCIWKRSGAELRTGPPLYPGSPKKGGRWDTASRKGPVSICLSAGSGFSRCSASSAISGSRPAVMPQPAPRASTPPPGPPPPSALGRSLPPAAGSGDASVATSALAAPAKPSAQRRQPAEPLSAPPPGSPAPPPPTPAHFRGPPRPYWSGGGTSQRWRGIADWWSRSAQVSLSQVIPPQMCFLPSLAWSPQPGRAGLD